MGRTGQGTERGSCPFLVNEREKKPEKASEGEKNARADQKNGVQKIMCRIQKFPVGSTKENRLLFNGKSRMIYIDITE